VTGRRPEGPPLTESPWSLVQYQNSDSPPRAGIRAHGAVHALPNGWPRTTMEILANWKHYGDRLASQSVAMLDQVPGARLVAPITYPRKLLCAGANYYSHAAELGTAEPDPAGVPFFFLKTPTTAIVGPDALIPIPKGDAPNFDWEAELGVVIGKGGKNIPRGEARSHVAGYVVANDLSARGLFSRSDSVSPVFAYDWVAHKSQDGSCPIGPGIVPAWLVPDIEDRRLRLTVNDEVKQDSTIGDLVVGIDGLVAAASEIVTLEPGDLILTGTPAGVGLAQGIFLAEGDVVVAEIDGVGEIRHTMIGGPQR